MPMISCSFSAVSAGRGTPLSLGTKQKGGGLPLGRTQPTPQGATAGNLATSPSNSSHWTNGKTEVQGIQNQDRILSRTSVPKAMTSQRISRGQIGLTSVCAHGCTRTCLGTGKVPGQTYNFRLSPRSRYSPLGPTPAQGFSGARPTGQGQGPRQALDLPPLACLAQCAGRGQGQLPSTSELPPLRDHSPHPHPRAGHATTQ